MSEDLFHHEVKAWKVGDLRQAIAGVRDELPVRLYVAEEPGGDLTYEQVAIAAAVDWDDVDSDGEPVDPWLEIGCEYPTGDYYRQA